MKTAPELNNFLTENNCLEKSDVRWMIKMEAKHIDKLELKKKKDIQQNAFIYAFIEKIKK